MKIMVFYHLVGSITFTYCYIYTYLHIFSDPAQIYVDIMAQKKKYWK